MPRFRAKRLGAWLLIGAVLGWTMAEPPANFNEVLVAPYRLPDPLKNARGDRVTTAGQWRRRRAEIVRLFEEEVYGCNPSRPPAMWFEVTSVDPHALHGLATRREVTLHLAEDRAGPKLHLLLYVPNHTLLDNASGPVPVFLGLNFPGNHTVASDPGGTLRSRWLTGSGGKALVSTCANEGTRGAEASRWQVEMVLSRGYALATICYEDIVPDTNNGYQAGVQSLYYKPGQTRPAPNEWGAVGAWAWGLSRALDYLETDTSVDARRVALVGHSRLGKAALWAGALDERFALVIANNSGCCGAKLSRRRFGETVRRINSRYPHWFCENFKKYSGQVERLPVDQHMLIALLAPRPVYIASGKEDRWADPRGEFLGAKHASPVYRLLGCEGLPADEMPPVDHPVAGTIGYHIRHGGHDVLAYDWHQFLNFADRHLREK